MIFLFFHCFRCIINPEAWKPRDFIVVMFPKIMRKGILNLHSLEVVCLTLENTCFLFNIVIWCYLPHIFL